MRTTPIVSVGISAFLACNVLATNRYVDLNSSNPVSPYTNWNSAAKTIQDAIDAAVAGDLVFVTNGVYETGGIRIGNYDVTNRVSINKPVTVASVNGPLTTAIFGSHAPGTNAIRCAWLTNGAVLSGFTLTNGSAGTGNYINGGGVSAYGSGAIISNCVLTGNIAIGTGGGAFRGTYLNCIFSRNYAMNGGAATYAVLIDCMVSNNLAIAGAGIDSSVATNCLIVGNFATNYGGGATFSTLVKSRIVGNTVSPGLSSYGGGGTYNTKLLNCLVLSNSTPKDGGGALSGSMQNCLVAWNRASDSGGTRDVQLTNCTVAFNIGTNAIGGAYIGSGAFQNCIIYYNDAPGSPNLMGKYNYCCTTPLLVVSPDSFTNAPLFVNPANGDFHLQSSSPCINAGFNSYVSSPTDLDGNARISTVTVDLGAYEYPSPPSRFSYLWAQQYGFPWDGSADNFDPDHDGISNWQEFRSGTNPTNAASVLKVSAPIPTNNSNGIIVTWQSVSGQNYFLERASNLALQPAFSIIRSNIAGLSGTTSFTDASATNSVPYFYRVGVP